MRLDYYNINTNIDYPLKQDAALNIVGGGSVPAEAIVDLGFVFGPYSSFDPLIHDVFLRDVEVIQSTSLTFNFITDIPDLPAHVLKADFVSADSFGTTKRLDYIGPPVTGFIVEGFITVGDLTELLALATGSYVLISPAPVEPAVIQSVLGTQVININLANARRICPECDSSSSSGDDVIVEATDIVGDVVFKQGYNSVITADDIKNSLTFNGYYGAGEGHLDIDPCKDIIIDDTGVHEMECQNCGKHIATINGMPGSKGKFKIMSGAGIRVTDDPDAHKITVEIGHVENC